MWQTRANEEMVMEYGHVLQRLLKLHQQPILDKLRLQEGVPVDRAVEKSLETQIPEKVSLKLLCKEILAVISCKVVDNCAKLLSSMLLYGVSKTPVEKHPVVYKRIYHAVEDFAILLPKHTILELGIGDGFAAVALFLVLCF